MIRSFFRENVHKSGSDPLPHWTIDAYGSDRNGLDKPIGCIHILEDFSDFEAHQKPRELAAEVNLFHDQVRG
jgi:hypothetical protein